MAQCVVIEEDYWFAPCEALQRLLSPLLTTAAGNVLATVEVI